MDRLFSGLAGWIGLAVMAVAAAAPENPSVPAPQGTPARYLLRYKFQPGDTLRWKVTHRARVEATVSGTSQSSESVTRSIKVWKVQKVEPSGVAAFEQIVEDVDMWQKTAGRMETRYNSRTDKQPPVGFEHVAKSVGVPLSRTTMDPQGKILARQHLVPRPQVEQEGLITIPFPDKAVAVGESWTLPFDIEVPLEGGRIRRVKSQQSFTLEEVKDGVASVRVVTQILTPIDDPALEAKLILRESSGRVKFSVEAGRVVAQQMDIDKRVIGFRGEASALHYRTQFTEELLSDSASAGEAASNRPAQSASRPLPAKAEARK